MKLELLNSDWFSVSPTLSHSLSVEKSKFMLIARHSPQKTIEVVQSQQYKRYKKGLKYAHN